MVDGPRAVVQWAARLQYDDLDARDAHGYTPLHIACQAPVYPVRDLSDGGYRDVVHADHDDTMTAGASMLGDTTDDDDDAVCPTATTTTTTTTTDDNDENDDDEPSVIQILLQANHTAASQGACIQDPSGRYPLHLALEHGKTWSTGVQALVEAYPEALCLPSGTGKWLPFQLAALRCEELSTVYAVVRSAPQVVQRKQQRVVVSKMASKQKVKL